MLAGEDHPCADPGRRDDGCPRGPRPPVIPDRMAGHTRRAQRGGRAVTADYVRATARIDGTPGRECAGHASDDPGPPGEPPPRPVRSMMPGQRPLQTAQCPNSRTRAMDCSSSCSWIPLGIRSASVVRPRPEQCPIYAPADRHRSAVVRSGPERFAAPSQVDPMSRFLRRFEAGATPARAGETFEALRERESPLDWLVDERRSVAPELPAPAIMVD